MLLLRLVITASSGITKQMLSARGQPDAVMSFAALTTSKGLPSLFPKPTTCSQPAATPSTPAEAGLPVPGPGAKSLPQAVLPPAP